MRSGILAAAFSLILAACGGGGGDSQSPTTPPVVTNPPVVIGTGGGTISETSGATVVIPEGAVAEATTFRIAMDSSGAPPLPSDLTAAGNTFVVTPHGGSFAEAVEVRLPAPAVTLEPNQRLVIAKAEPGEDWVLLNDTEFLEGKYSVKVGDFSYFRLVVVTYPQPLLLGGVPLKFGSSVRCDDGSGNSFCTFMIGPQTVIYTATGNGGQLPINCDADSLFIGAGRAVANDWMNTTVREPITMAGGRFQRVLSAATYQSAYRLGIGGLCNGVKYTFGQDNLRVVRWQTYPNYPELSIIRAPETLDIVEGTFASLDVLMSGGAYDAYAANTPRTPSPTDHAIIDWQRSDDHGTSWRDIARTLQDEANPFPFNADPPWQPWGASHGFIATAADKGALIRIHACYTPPAPLAAPPCVTSIPTLLNVLHQSSVPAIVDAPRSVLIRTGETANFSVTASGLPAPTLQWQTRPANSTGAWTNVASGTGITTPNYTTPVRALSDNGTQYRVVATNAVGSAASGAVTLSVSDLSIAPTITTQPGSLSVVSGGDAVFAVDARGTEALSYQWQFNGANIAGGNAAVLRLTSVTNTNAGSYRVTVRNDAGAVLSDVANLVATTSTPLAVAPAIVTQPSAVTVNVGNTATFAVGVDGSGPLTFQWRREGSNITGATSAVYTIASAALPNAGAYSVVVTNTAGSVTSNPAALDVSDVAPATPPTIVTQPATLIVAPGGSGVLAVGAAGSGPLSYQWKFNGTNIVGATSPVLTLTNASGATAGNYSVVVTNAVSSVTSQTASVILLGAPVITQQPVAVTASEGATATFTVTASGSDLRYQWLLNGQPIGGASQASYTTPTLAASSSGSIYSVSVFNTAGPVFSQAAVLTVTAQPGVSTSLVSAAQVGGPANLSSRAPTISGDGNVVAFISNGTNLVPGTVRSGNAYARNRTTGITTLINQTPTHAESSGPVGQIALSANGRYVIFTSAAGDLVAGDTNNAWDIFRRDLQTGTTMRLSLRGGNQLAFGCGADVDYQLGITADGNNVTFLCAYDLVFTGDANSNYFLYYRNVASGSTRWLGGAGGIDLAYSALSNDGNWIVWAYNQPAPNEQGLVIQDIVGDGTYRIFNFAQPDVGDGLRPGISISDNGKYVAFSMVSQSVLGSTQSQVVVVDRDTKAISTIASQQNGVAGNGASAWPRISGDGRHVMFSTTAPSLTNNLGSASQPFVVVADLVSHATVIASRKGDGSPVRAGTALNNDHALSQDGSTVAFVGDHAEVLSGSAGSLQVFATSAP